MTVPAQPQGTAVRTWARTLAGMQKEAITRVAGTGVAWRFVSDEGPYLAGHDAAPCPLSFFTAGLAASYMNGLLLSVRHLSMPIRGVRLVLDNLYSMHGSVLRGTMKGGALAPRLRVEFETDVALSELQQMVSATVCASPIAGLLGTALKNRFALYHNGRAVTPRRVRRLEASGTLDRLDPDIAFRQDRDPTGPPIQLVGKLAAVERVEGKPGGVNTSLQEHQDRRLHCRGVCTVRPDGLLEVEQTLLKPIGSSFRFLCEGVNPDADICAPDIYGTLKSDQAPDAASYISAGIAFCFMTQAGRYAEIVRRPIDDCDVVQDTRVISADACPGANRGTAVPVETHLHLWTRHDDTFAATTLDMSEQTCFLHALCRTELETEVVVSRRLGD